MSKPSSSNNDAHEKSDINTRATFIFGAGLIAGIVLASLAVSGLMSEFGKHGPKSSIITNSPPLPPEPRLQSNPPRDMARFREQENNLLNSYGWVDRNARTVHIPIDRAMDLIVERGLLNPPASSIGKTPLQMRQEKAGAERTSP